MSEKKKYQTIYTDLKGKLKGRKDDSYGRENWGREIEGHLESQLKPNSLLDVGCGYGVFCNNVSAFVPKVYGCDIASVATGNVVKGSKVVFLDSSADSIPLEDGTVEFVCSFDCLEHCEPHLIDKVLAEFDRLATRGFVISVSYDAGFLNGVPVHLTVKPHEWWLEKFSQFGKVDTTHKISATGYPYYIVLK